MHRFEPIEQRAQLREDDGADALVSRLQISELTRFHAGGQFGLERDTDRFDLGEDAEPLKRICEVL